MRSLIVNLRVVTTLCLIWLGIAILEPQILTQPCLAQDLPNYVVPGHEQEMRLLQQLHRLHHAGAFTHCTLWDGWLPQATVWVDDQARERYRQSLLAKKIDTEGYVAMQQHRGMAHSDGWPFPAWQQSTGRGFHFSILGEEWAVANFKTKPLDQLRGWEIEGAEVVEIDPGAGLKLKANADTISITTPRIGCGTIVAPFLRLEWAASDLGASCQPKLLWQLDGESQWQPDRFATFAALTTEQGMQYVNLPMYRQPGYAGLLNRVRLVIDQAAQSQITIKSLITAIDTRHPTTSWNYLQACCSYYAWSGDVDFLKANLARMRTALEYGIREFSLRDERHVLVRWVGHGGQSGLVPQADGKNRMLPGIGVGNNYWDLLPFGGHDALATILAYDALERMSELERTIDAHPEWQLSVGKPETGAAELARLAKQVRDDFQKRFWSEETGRFVGWIDLDGKAYDYGFTFVNLEAIAYGLASERQSGSILQWLDGHRMVGSDTSTGQDIYHWRFAPRATTRRNVETYVWVWNGPQTIAWGNQVQDGGAVLGFSYHDLMARLRTSGPDDAWQRLQKILSWFDEVQQAGGYRSYYSKPDRGTLQGGGTAGGLGLDQEFLESVLVPQVMLYGFLGATPRGEQLAIEPKLPIGWPSLTITGIHFRDSVLDITAHQNGRIEYRIRKSGQLPIQLITGNQGTIHQADN